MPSEAALSVIHLDVLVCKQYIQAYRRQALAAGNCYGVCVLLLHLVDHGEVTQAEN